MEASNTQEFKNCPICLQVPENEIYQCTTGHSICDQCLSKLPNGKCPFCRLPYGETKIRSISIEENLDRQLFECQFKGIGCTQLCKRQELSSHAESCSVYLHSIPVCSDLNLHENCDFRLGFVTRSEIISHFEYSNLKHLTKNKFCMSGKQIWKQFNEKKVSDELLAQLKHKFSIRLLFSPDKLESSPVFFLLSTFDFHKACFSTLCVQLWGSKPSAKYNVTYCLHKQISSASSGQETTGNSSAALSAFPIQWTTMVCSNEDAGYFYNENVINVPFSLLKESQFGAVEEDVFTIRLNELKPSRVS